MIKFYLRLTFFLLATIVSIFTYGQKVFTKSYLVLSNNDTLQGFIQEHPNFNKIDAINFKKENINAEELKYPITDILSFYLYDDTETYLSQEVEIDKKPVEISKLENTLSKKIVKERVLLKVLVSGKVDLYRYVDESGKEHFFYKNDGKVTELGYVRFISKSGQMAELPEFKQQLTNLFADCEKMSKSKYSYSMSSFVKYFKEYNVCTQSLSYSSEKSKVIIIPSLQFGLVYNHLNYVGEDNFNGFSGDFAGQWKYTPKLNMMIGIAFDFKSKKVSNPFVVNMTVDWRQAGEFIGSNNVEDPFTKRKDYSITLSYLGLSTAIKYSFAKKSILKPFIKFGIGFNYLLSDETSMKTTLFGKSTISEPLIDLSKGGLGLVSSVGCSVRRFQFEICYTYTQFAASTSQATLHINSPAITVGYAFSK